MTALIIAILLSADPAPGTFRTLDGRDKDTYLRSVKLCYFIQWQKTLKEQIADERAIGKIGGVVNQSEIYRLSKNLYSTQQSEARYKARKKGEKFLSCTAPGIARMVECLMFADSGWRDGDCLEDEDWKAFREDFTFDD